jgi:fluoride exporter
MQYLAILFGGGFGALCRYLLSKWISNYTGAGFPWGTIAINLIGCLTIGFLTGLFEKWIISPNLRLFIFIGVLGGFTTFSTFGLESFYLLKGGEIKLFLFNVIFSNLFGIGLVFAGYMLSQKLVNR